MSNEIFNNLPQGNSRNKIEYLAKCIGQLSDSQTQLTDSQKQITVGLESINTAPKNLLVNPDLSHSSVDMVHASSYSMEWLTRSYTYKDQSASEMHLGRSFGRPAPVGWGVEVVPINGVSDYHSVMYANSGGDVEKFDHAAKATYLLATGSNSRVLHFSVFSAPYDKELRVLNDANAWETENESFSLYFRGEKNSAVRFGLLELDQNGDFVAYAAQKAIPPESGFNTFSETWLHGIKLKAGVLYAYFVESDTSINAFTSSPVSAGVFQNPDQLDVIPDLTPSDTVTRRLRLTESFGDYTKAALQSGITLNVNKFMLPFGMEKHLIFASLKGTVGNYMAQNVPATITKVNYEQVAVQGELSGSDTSAHIMAFYSETPVHLNYFRSGSYQAV